MAWAQETNSFSGSVAAPGCWIDGRYVCGGPPPPVTRPGQPGGASLNRPRDWGGASIQVTPLQREILQNRNPPLVGGGNGVAQ